MPFKVWTMVHVLDSDVVNDHTYMYIRTLTYNVTHTLVQTRVQTHAHMYTRASSREKTRTHARTHLRTRNHAQSHTITHTFTYTHTHTHAHTRTHMMYYVTKTNVTPSLLNVSMLPSGDYLASLACRKYYNVHVLSITMYSVCEFIAKIAARKNQS